jgi:hypothetical protein
MTGAFMTKTGGTSAVDFSEAWWAVGLAALLGKLVSGRHLKAIPKLQTHPSVRA